VKLLVGLGNPGPQYETTRHNAGFLMLDLLAEAEGINWEGGTNRFGGEMAKGRVLGEECILLKPMTFMNLSGRSVGEVMRFFKFSPSDVIVLHDELDVPAGKVKAREGGGAGGHNGIRSIIKETGVEDFHRVKLGIGKPVENEPAGTGWVLGQFTDDELLALQNEMFESVKVRLKGIFDKDAAAAK
jgi:PTH1 family peptidyl-tRNA hydrolase